VRKKMLLVLMILGYPWISSHNQLQAQFVTAQNGKFMLNGQSFYFGGSDEFDLPASQVYAPTEVDARLNACATCGVTVLRIFFFYDGGNRCDADPDPETIQTSLGVYQESALVALDQVVKKVKDKGMKIIATLTNWGDAGGGLCRYMYWTGHVAAPCDFDPGNTSQIQTALTATDVKAAIKSYYSMILNRVNTVTGVAYKNEPTIMAWEIANEPRGHGLGTSVLTGWLNEMAQYIKSIDSNHLVDTGEEGFDKNLTGRSSFFNGLYGFSGEEGLSFTDNTALSSIDFASIHCYPMLDSWGDAITGGHYFILDANNIAQSYGKPLVLGEYGHASSPYYYPGANDAAKLQAYNNWWPLIESLPVGGDLLWQLLEDGAPWWMNYSSGNVWYTSDSQIWPAFKQHALNMTAKAAPGGTDTTPPTISSISTSGLTYDAVTISWQTNENADTKVVYGKTTTYTDSTTVSGYSMSHSANLSNLDASTLYHYRVKSKDYSSNLSVSSDNTFTTSAAPPAIQNGLVLAYGFNTGSGNFAYDSSGQQNIGTISGATWTTSGKFGNALSFNGSTSKVTVGDASCFHLTTGITLEAWVYLTGFPSDLETILCKQSKSLTPSYTFYITPHGTAQNDSLKPELPLGLNTGNVWCTSSTRISLNTWTHVAATFDGSTCKIYVNGNLTGQLAATGSINVTDDVIMVGANNGEGMGEGERFLGRMDELRIYNRALSQAEIQTDMNTPVGSPAGSPPSAPTLSSPANGATGIATNPTLSWNASDGATSYGLQVSTSSNFSSTGVNQTGITATSSVVTGLANNTIYYWRVNATNSSGTSAWSSSRSFTTTASNTNHSIALPQGWSMISSFVQPNNVILDSLLPSIKPQLEILKNGGGQVYWPAQGINAIGNWDSRYGYQIYMNAADTLTVTGSLIAPETTPIPLVNGANLVAYLRYTPMQVDSALTSIASSLIIVKNNAGQVYWPSQGINSIGSMKPGQGYQVQVAGASTLTYPVNSGATPQSILTKQMESSSPISDVLYPKHYMSSVSNTGATAILLVQSPELSSGDEIAAWTSQRLLVGSGVMNQGKALITIWGDNSLSETIDGATNGEVLSLTVWSQATQQEQTLTFTSITEGLTSASLGTTLRYKTDAVWIANVERTEQTPTGFMLFQNYPNPFNPSCIIRYGLPFATRVSLEVYNVLGQRVATLVSEEQQAGYHQVVFENSALGSGVYFYRLSTNNLTITKKMMVVR
jgi:hypothetical protein